MSALDNRPGNLNLLSQVGFKFDIARAPNFNYFIQKVDFPGVTIPTVNAPNPLVKSPLPGDHLEYETVRIQFKLDEDLRGYFELYDWITSLGKPESFDQAKAIYAAKPYEKNGVFSEGTLVILNNKMMPNVKVTFQDMLPVRLSGFTLQTDANDIQYITASMELSYLLYKYEYVT